MNSAFSHRLACAIAALTASASLAWNAHAATAGNTRAQGARSALPLRFETNTGQTDGEVKFLARGPGFCLFLTPGGNTLVARKPSDATAVRTTLAGANPGAIIEGLDPATGCVNYFTGADPEQWRVNVPTFQRVAYRGAYPGVDLIFHGRQGQLEYDFVLAPGADPASIRLQFDGVDDVEVDERGDLVLHTAGGEVRQLAPVTFQENADGRREIATRYVLHGPMDVGFEVAEYDRSQPLTIDPVLWYSTYWGGDALDSVNAIAVDTVGNCYTTGTTASTLFPRTNGSIDVTINGGTDVFVSKFGPTSSAGQIPAIIYSTFLGGSADDEGHGIATDSSGNAYVTGKTTSTNFPLAAPFQSVRRGLADAFVTKLNATGSALIYSTYLGGDDAVRDEGNAISVRFNEAYVAGQTFSNTFPTTTNAFRRTAPQNGDIFLTRFNTAGSALIYSTYLGGTNTDAALGLDVDNDRIAYITGFTGSSDFPTKAPPGQSLPAFQATKQGAANVDAFVAKIDTDSSGASSLIYSTYFGGTGNDFGTAIIVDSLQRAHFVGHSGSPDFPQKLSALALPVKPLGGDEDAFIAKLNADGTAIFYSMLIGGNASDRASGIGFDKTGVWMTGETTSTNFPVSADALQPTFLGVEDAFLTQIVAKEVLGRGGVVIGTSFGTGYSTYFGGTGQDRATCLAVESGANIHIAGQTTSRAGSGFPILASPAPLLTTGNFEGFISKIGRIDQAPVVTCAVATDTLWPPNGQFVNVDLTLSAIDDTDPHPVVKVTVFSDETDVDTAGGGVAVPDVSFTPGILKLRAERRGGGDGRVYLILVTATDAAGHTGYSCCSVTVPHSQSGKAIASVENQAVAAETEGLGSGNAPAGYIVLTSVPTRGPK